MLTLDVVPERSLGCEQWEFVLGMHFCQAVAIIQSQVGIIKGVQVLYNDKNPLSVDLILDLPQDGIRFVFHPVNQRLKMIEIVNLKNIKLQYCGVLFNAPEVMPTIEQVEHTFGATHPGVFDAEKQTFTLNFRGISFCFNVDSKFQAGNAQCGLGSLQFANGASPNVSRVIIFSGHPIPGQDMLSVPSHPLSCYKGLTYLERLDVQRDHRSTKGFQVQFYLEGSGVNRGRKVSHTREIQFGMSCQDVTSMLGTPSQVFYKSEDKMKIHSPNIHKHITVPRRSDYFFNYFTLGFDILFDAKTHKVKKFIVHTNFPGHYNFNIYHRCEFNIALTTGKSKYELSNDCKKYTDKKSKSIVVTTYTKWDEISEKLKHSERPVVLNRGSSENSTNPFGSTFCYGYQDMVFEVMQNQHIASITFYQSDIEDDV
ncbi:PHAF1 protein CG7083 [Adelges cooleyi]|uniref:PHAF1 protein CG7083 n=1 Tax=Adelges cooleyi TaxID=133065 RepID=UPI0021801761|nr:PHAF1 protein CG7083 [Adelges cooleyi]